MEPSHTIPIKYLNYILVCNYQTLLTQLLAQRSTKKKKMILGNIGIEDNNDRYITIHT